MGIIVRLARRRKQTAREQAALSFRRYVEAHRVTSPGGGGGEQWLKSCFGKVRASARTARSLWGRAFSACMTPTRSGRVRRGTSTARAITSSPQVTPTRPTTRTAPTRTRSQSTRCRAIITSFLPSRTTATSPHGAGSGIRRQRPTAGGRTAESQTPEAAKRTITCRFQSPCTCIKGPRNKSHIAREAVIA